MPPKLRPLPTPDQARAGLRVAFENAERHVTVAEILGAAAHYGPACAHLILAIEESVKARALGWIWMERNEAVKTYDDQDMRERLSWHGARHPAAIVQSWSGGLQADIVARTLREAVLEQASQLGVSLEALQEHAARQGATVPTSPAGLSGRPRSRRGIPTLWAETGRARQRT